MLKEVSLPRYLATSLLIGLCAGRAFASDPFSDGEILLKADPGAISVAGDYKCTVLDQGLAALVPDQGSIRWVREFTPGSGNHFVLRPLDPEARSALIDQLTALACIERAEPNYTLTADSDASNPSDFYFQEEFWPYPPMSDNPTGLYYPDQNYPTCENLGDSETEYPTQEDHYELPDQWHLQLTQTNLAWLVEQGNSDVKVAIIDSGVDWRHPDLGPNIWQNVGELGEDADGDGEVIRPTILSGPDAKYSPWEFDGEYDDIYGDDIDGADGNDADTYVDNVVGIRIHHWLNPPTLPRWDPNHGHCYPGVDVYDDSKYGEQSSHGTQMASILGAAHNGFGCVGVCPKLSIVPINAGKSIESDIGYKHVVGVSEMLEALDFAMATKVDIINISLSYGADMHDESTDLAEKLEDAKVAGIIICCSAGNKNTDGTRWPAAYDFVQTCAVVRHDLVKAKQSSFASYVDFSAPSGEKEVSGGNQLLSGDEFMAATKWTDPEPFWPDEVPPHDGSHDTGPVHTYKALDGDTSGGAAQLSGAFALLKAHYPDHSRQQLIDEMVRGAVDVDSYQDAVHVGNLGHGLINPYRSLTEWGGPRDTEILAGNVTWSGEVWISGDYEVPGACTLTIDPGTTVHIANFDNEHIGTDAIRIIADQIYAIGTESDSIRFRSFGPDTESNNWSFTTREGTESVVQLSYCDFENLWQFTATGSATAADTSFIRNSNFLDPTNSSLQALELKDIHLTQCEFGPKWTLLPSDSVRIEWCKIEHDPTWLEFMPAIVINGSVGGRFFIENSIIRDSKNGIRFDCTGSDTLILSNVLIEHAYEAGVQDRGETGIDVRSGKVRADHLTLSGYTLGVSTQGDSKFDAEYSSFTDCYQAALNNPGDFLMFFGNYVSPGHPLNTGGINIFEDNEWLNIMNLHATGTISARHNWWGSPMGPPPKSNKGLFDTLHHLLVAPYLPPPPNFAEMVDEQSPAFAVGRNFPNPFNPVTQFTFTIPSGGGRLRATVYDIRGRRVRDLADHYLGSGEHRIEFDGRDDSGAALSSGMYLCRFNFRDREEIVKATLVK